MKKRLVVWGGMGVALLLLAGFGAWLFTLPPATSPGVTSPITQEEADATVAALKPTKRQRPLIAIIGINDATEVTDYLVPYGILHRADVADVVALATSPGPVNLFPALKVEPQATIAEFDARNPEGADYVIVPAMSRDDDPAALEWIKSQAAKGAIVVGVCAGAKVVGETGMLDGKRGTTHWYYLKELRKKHPGLDYVADRRLVVDGKVATTTGITASMPMMLTLVEAIAGRQKAEAVGRDLGLERWDARHDSAAFRFTRPFALTVMSNMAALWNREQFGIELSPGIDEVSLALVADAWSRTYRSRAVTFATNGPVETRSGLRIVPDEVATNWPEQYRLTVREELQPAKALDDTLREIETRYGARTADVVSMQLEYPRKTTQR